MVTFVAIAAPVVAVAAGTAGDDVITGGDVVAATIFAGDAAGPSGEKQPPDGPARISSASAYTMNTRGYNFGRAFLRVQGEDNDADRASSGGIWDGE